jgi:hypothetical protein
LYGLLKALFRIPNSSPRRIAHPGRVDREFGDPILLQLREDAMEMRLSDDEISALQSLDFERGPTSKGVREDELPKKLFEFNLISRQPGGRAIITKSGQRALFRHECVLALEALARGEEIALGSGVEKWLLASGFVKPSDDGGAMDILPRGLLWLSSLEPDAKVEIPRPTAESFAARRS